MLSMYLVSTQISKKAREQRMKRMENWSRRDASCLQPNGGTTFASTHILGQVKVQKGAEYAEVVSLRVSSYENEYVNMTFYLKANFKEMIYLNIFHN